MDLIRNVNISEECRVWMRMSNKIRVTDSEADMVYETECAKIRDAVQNAIVTKPAEPSVPGRKTEVVAEVRLEKSLESGLMMVVTRVYTVVYMKHGVKFYVIRDKNEQFKRVFWISDDIYIKNGRRRMPEKLQNLKMCKSRISM